MLDGVHIVRSLSQDAALHREYEVIDERLQAVPAAGLEVGCGRPKQGVWPLFNGIQVSGKRLKGSLQSSQIGTHFYIHGRHRWN
jgi:hypothetical protein